MDRLWPVQRNLERESSAERKEGPQVVIPEMPTVCGKEDPADSRSQGAEEDVNHVVPQQGLPSRERQAKNSEP
jgi:hypothetical protein